MACHYPIPAYLSRDGKVTFERKDKAFGKRGLMHIPCGMCRGCKADHARDWAIRCYHESQLHTDAAFINPTYAPAHLPPGGTLVPDHLRLFFMRLRKDGHKFRYFACGEYGEKRGRPHYHICMFGWSPPRDRIINKSATGGILYESDYLNRKWKYGSILFSDFTPATARYTAHYTADKLKKYSLDELDPDTGLRPYEKMTDDGEVVDLVPEFQRQSLKPGIGIPWLEKNWREVFPADSVVMDGREYPPPKAYWKWLKENQPETARKVLNKRIADIEGRPYVTGLQQHLTARAKIHKLKKFERSTHEGKQL